MESRKLGHHGPAITTVGFGSWATGGAWLNGSRQNGWSGVDDDDSVAAIQHAIDSGVNWIDTAAVYGLGHSERVVGRAVTPYRVHEDVYVFTKCGVNWYDDGIPKRTLRPDAIRYECEQSLERLGLDSIDL